jgi:hypothetical protein
MRQGSGPSLPHVHPIDEWFYVHRFKVTSPVCRALNGYTPAGFEQMIIGLAKPAERRELPPLMDPPDQITIDKVFNNYWCAEARDGWALSRLGIR